MMRLRSDVSHAGYAPTCSNSRGIGAFCCGPVLRELLALAAGSSRLKLYPPPRARRFQRSRDNLHRHRRAARVVHQLRTP